MRPPFKKEKCKQGLACRILYLAVDSVPKLSKNEYWFFSNLQMKKVRELMKMSQIIFPIQQSHVLHPSCQALRFILRGRTTGPLTLMNLFPGLQYLTCIYPSICFKHWNPSLREGLLCLQPTQGDQLRKDEGGAFVKASQWMAPLVAGVLSKASFWQPGHTDSERSKFPFLAQLLQARNHRNSE